MYELGTLHHTILRKLLTKINVCLFHSSNLYWWLRLLKGMHQLLENILQAHPNFSRFSKKRFHKVDDTPSYLWLKSIGQRRIFSYFLSYSNWWLLFKWIHQITGNILQKSPSSFRFSNQWFQTIDSTPPYFYLKRLIKITDLCISGCVL